MKQSIADRLEQTGGVTSGFDYLRIGLAAAILCWHTVQVSAGTSQELVAMQTPLKGLVRLLLPMFFALSGFLVCGSLLRSRTLVGFCVHRVLRLVPALAVEIVLSALILGPLLTTSTLGAYFSAPEIRAYFLNIVGDIHYFLPGVFTDNPHAGIVNGNLWTIPFELECYVALMVIAVSSLLRRRVLFTSVVVAAWLGYWAVTARMGWVGGLPPGSWGVPGKTLVLLLPGRTLVLTFLAGVLLYVWRDRIPLTRTLFAASALGAYALVSVPELSLLAPLPVAYLTVYLGLTSPRKIRLVTDGDYSYGMYLFAYPIQQTFACLFPEARIWWLNLLVALPASVLYAYGSWHLVEKPVLGRRKRLVAMVERGVASLRAVRGWFVSRASRPPAAVEPAPE